MKKKTTHFIPAIDYALIAAVIVVLCYTGAMALLNVYSCSLPLTDASLVIQANRSCKVKQQQALIAQQKAALKESTETYQKPAETKTGIVSAQINTIAKPFTIISVGDIFLGRYVETLMQRNGGGYPFQNISSVLQGHDVVMGNLESPFFAGARQTPSGSLRFSVKPERADELRNAGFTLLGLANNHMSNYGEAGVQETKNILTERGISFTGQPQGFDSNATYYTSASGTVYAVVAFNTLAPMQMDQVLQHMAELQQKSVFTVVTIHWGNEYKLTSNITQRDLAHSLIDAGADLIIGHHPHVVQEIEQYNNALIFYSLGNFVFDQYFSVNTQQALMAEIILTDSAVTAQLLPVSIVKSQPALMQGADTTAFLKSLAERSTIGLKNSIEQGYIYYQR